jgi:hypothetical protein
MNIPGGRFNISDTKSELEMIMCQSPLTPGPGAHYPEKSVLHKTPGGKFNISNTKSDLERIIDMAARTPGPGAYSLDNVKNVSKVSKINMALETVLIDNKWL